MQPMLIKDVGKEWVDSYGHGTNVVINYNEFVAPIPRNFEAAGHGYHKYVLNIVNKNGDNMDKSKPMSKTQAKKAARLRKKREAAEAEAAEKSLNNIIDMSWEKFKHYNNINLKDYYALLNLSKLGFRATSYQINQAYKKASLMCHPDKASVEDNERAEERFKALQQAYDELSDPDKRRSYESSVDFDDSIPLDDEGITDDRFYDVYNPVFIRNSKWSIKTNVPSLGDDTTPWNEVNDFYDFWFSFQSWREFKIDDDHDLEDAESRDEKRWMLKENKRMTAHMKKQEVTRLRKLVDDAMKKDPRVRIHTQKMKEAKKAKKTALRERKRLQEEKARQIELEIQRKKEDELKQQQIEHAKQKAKTADMRSKRREIRQYCRRVCNDDMDDNLQLLIHFDHEGLLEMSELCNNHNSDDYVIKQLKNIFIQMKDKLRKQREEAQEKMIREKLAKRIKDEEKFKEKSKHWSKIEEGVLVKAVIKFPGGVPKRWELITDMVNNVGHNDRSQKEVLKKVKYMETQKTAAAVGTNENNNQEEEEQTKKRKKVEWSALEQAELEKALRTVPKCENRWEKIAELVGTKTMKQCVKRFKLIRKQIMAAKKS